MPVFELDTKSLVKMNPAAVILDGGDAAIAKKKLLSGMCSCRSDPP
jgi:hypothetical protein